MPIHSQASKLKLPLLKTRWYLLHPMFSMRKISAKLRKPVAINRMISLNECTFFHPFRIFVSKSPGWESDGFLKIGHEWFIRISRTKDGRIYLLDQISFFILQLSTTTLESHDVVFETKILFGLSKSQTLKIQNRLRQTFNI